MPTLPLRPLGSPQVELHTLPSRLELGGNPVRIAVVIPAFRVARHIANVIRGIPEFISEIVVVDDASPDDTAEVVGGLADPRVHLLRHEHNGGVGAAMIPATAMRWTSGRTWWSRWMATSRWTPTT